jgi:hypothetical protein
MICLTGRAENFCAQVWTGRTSLNGLSNFAAARNRHTAVTEPKPGQRLER